MPCRQQESNLHPLIPGREQPWNGFTCGETDSCGPSAASSLTERQYQESKDQKETKHWIKRGEHKWKQHWMGREKGKGHTTGKIMSENKRWLCFAALLHPLFFLYVAFHRLFHVIFPTLVFFLSCLLAFYRPFFSVLYVYRNRLLAFTNWS